MVASEPISRLRGLRRVGGVLHALRTLVLVAKNRRRVFFFALALAAAGALPYVLLGAVDTANSPTDATDSKGMLLVSSVVLALLLLAAVIGCVRLALRPARHSRSEE